MVRPAKHRFRPGRPDDARSKPFPVADAETIDSARNGDQEALAEVWRVYHPQVLRLLQAKRTESAADVARQVWVEVGRSIAHFDGDGIELQRWIFTVTSQHSTDETPRRWRSSRDRQNRTPSRTADEIDLDSETLADALGFIGILDPTTAEAVMLRVVHGLSVADVASITGRTEGDVRLFTHRGVAQLRRTLAERSEEDPPE